MNIIQKLNDYRVIDDAILMRLSPPSLAYVPPPPVIKKTTNKKGKKSTTKPKKASVPKQTKPVIQYDFEPIVKLFDAENIEIIDAYIEKYGLQYNMDKFQIDTDTIGYIGGIMGDEIMLQLGTDENYYLSYTDYNRMKTIWFCYNRTNIHNLFDILSSDDDQEIIYVEENLENITKNMQK